MTFRKLFRHGEELASVEHGDILRTVRTIWRLEGRFYQTEHEEEGITGDVYDEVGFIRAEASSLEELEKIGDPNIIEDLCAEAAEALA